MSFAEVRVELRTLARIAKAGTLRSAVRKAMMCDAVHNVERGAVRDFPSFELSRVARRTLASVVGTLDEPVTIVNFEFYEQNLLLADLVTLLAFARSRRPTRVAEIGTAFGMTTLNLSAALPDAKIWTVDIAEYAENSCKEVWVLGQRVVLQTQHLIGERFLARPDVANNVTVVTSNSGTWQPPEQLNLVFVDGAHDYNGVKADSEMALRNLAPGGTIVWDDFEEGSWGVPDYISELAKDLNLYTVEGTRLVFYES